MAYGPNLLHMTKLNYKIVVSEEIMSPCTHIKELTDAVNQLLPKNERLNKDLAIQKTVCGNLQKRSTVWITSTTIVTE